MAIQSEGNAPYAPAGTVIEMIERYRNHGLTEPFDMEVLERAGVPESLSARTLQSLKLLDLVDDIGFPTEHLRDLAKVPSSDFQERLAALLRSAYAEVFSFVDPANDPIERVEDAFRTFLPRGQRGRMVTLFLGLCQYAGIVNEAPRRKPGPKAQTSSGPRSTGPSPTRTVRRPLQDRPVGGQAPPTASTLPAPLAALLADLPSVGPTWTETERGSFVGALTSLLDVYYPVRGTIRGELMAGPKN